MDPVRRSNVFHQPLPQSVGLCWPLQCLPNGYDYWSCVEFVPVQWRSILRRFATTPAPQTASASSILRRFATTPAPQTASASAQPHSAYTLSAAAGSSDLC